MVLNGPLSISSYDASSSDIFTRVSGLASSHPPSSSTMSVRGQPVSASAVAMASSSVAPAQHSYSFNHQAFMGAPASAS